MNEATRRYPDLVDRQWRLCGVRIAVSLLLYVPNYYNWTKDRIRIMCKRSFIATLPKGPNAVFEANEQTKEVYNILGTKYIKDITCLRVDMNFIFEWSTRYLTSERSERVRYRVDHEKIKFISISGHVMFCLLYKHQ